MYYHYYYLQSYSYVQNGLMVFVMRNAHDMESNQKKELKSSPVLKADYVVVMWRITE